MGSMRVSNLPNEMQRQITTYCYHNSEMPERCFSRSLCSANRAGGYK